MKVNLYRLKWYLMYAKYNDLANNTFTTKSKRNIGLYLLKVK